jgi:hypothetical protein
VKKEGVRRESTIDKGKGNDRQGRPSTLICLALLGYEVLRTSEMGKIGIGRQERKQ